MLTSPMPLCAGRTVSYKLSCGQGRPAATSTCGVRPDPPSRTTSRAAPCALPARRTSTPIRARRVLRAGRGDTPNTTARFPARSARRAPRTVTPTRRRPAPSAPWASTPVPAPQVATPATRYALFGRAPCLVALGLTSTVARRESMTTTSTRPQAVRLAPRGRARAAARPSAPIAPQDTLTSTPTPRHLVSTAR